MEIALEAAQAGARPIYTHGPLIHNPQVLEMLEKKGVSVLPDVEALQTPPRAGLPGGTVIVRAHGIAPEERKAIGQKGVEIADATCPHVLRVQTILKRHVEKGYTCIIVGDQGHAEVVGLLGFAAGKGFVVESLDDVEKIPASEKMAVVAQTTQDRGFYEKVCEALSKRFPDICIFDTICDSTSQRQAEVLELAREVDAMIVVGGRGSANTNRLANISKSTGKPTFHVEQASELDKGALRAFRVVGVTAGASTPTWLINEVVDYVRGIPQTPFEYCAWAFSWAFQLALVTCLYAAVGAGFLTYASAALMGASHHRRYALIAAMAVLGLHLLNRALEKSTSKAEAPLFSAFYTRYRLLLISAVVGAVGCALALAATLGWLVMALLAVCCLAGIVYRLRIIPPPVAALLGHKSLQDIPGTKELFIATAWTVVAVMPAAVHEVGFRASVLVAAVFTFTLTFLRIVALDVREIQWDAIVGRETIPVVFGLRATKVLLVVLAIGLAGILLAAGRFAWALPVAYLLLVNVAYACGYLYSYHRRWITRGVVYEGIVDANFILAGILAYLYSHTLA
jgi:4-hydroxy-3-methylbut-2-enyl diphosphate reductase